MVYYPERVRQRIEHQYRLASYSVFKKPFIEHTGRHIAAEIVEASLKNISFSIKGIEHPEALIPALFDADLFGLGINMYEHIRDFHLSFDCNVVTDEKWAVDTHDLDLLKELKHRDAARIRIYRPGSYDSQPMVFKVMKSLLEWLYKARDGGHKFECELEFGEQVVDLWRFVGTSKEDFEAFKAMWPKEVSRTWDRWDLIWVWTNVCVKDDGIGIDHFYDEIQIQNITPEEATP